MSPAPSPSWRRIAIGVFTFTPSVPAGTRILPIVPSSTASTSMVALSVSISAMTSPEVTLSPSFFSHLARLPSSMVGDSAGIRMSIGIARPPSMHHVGPELGRIRLGIGLGKLGSVGDDVAHLLVHGLQIVLARPLLLDEPRPDLLDRVMLGPHLLHFLLGAVLCRVGHGVTTIA